MNMGFIIDTIFGVADAVDDIKLNIQDMWYEKKLDHYINKYNSETGNYPESVVKRNNKEKPKMVSSYQPFVIPGTVYNGIPVPNNTTPKPPVQTSEPRSKVHVPEHAKESVKAKTEVVVKPSVPKNNKIEKGAEAKVDEIKSSTEAKKDPPTEAVDPAEKEAPVEEAGAENYITIDALEGKTDHTETAKMQLAEQSKLDEVVKNMVEETLNASSKTETTTSKNKNTRTRKTK